MQLIEFSQETSMCRPLGAWEQLFWVSEQVHPTHSVLTVKISGELSIEQLEQALIQVQQRQLLLRVRIAFDEAQKPWFVEDTAKIPLRVIPRQGEEHWQQELERELSERFVCTEAPLIRVVLLHSTKVSELILSSHHCIFDGTSNILLTQEILQALDKPNALIKPLPAVAAMENLIPNISDDNLLPANFEPKNIGWLKQSSLKTKLTSHLPGSSNFTDDKIFSAEILPQLHFASISQEQTQLLISRCQQEKTTIYSVLYAAFLLAVARQNTSSKLQTLKCFFSINMRLYLKPIIEKHIGYYSHGKVILKSLTANVNLWELARSIENQLKKDIKSEKIHEEVLASQKWLSSTNPSINEVSQALAEQFNNGVTVSHLGQVQFSPQLEQFKVLSIYGPVGVPIPTAKNQWLVEAATVENQLCLALVLPKLTISSAQAKQLLQEAISLLQN